MEKPLSSSMLIDRGYTSTKHTHEFCEIISKKPNPT